MTDGKIGDTLSKMELFKKILNRFYYYWLDFELMILAWVGLVPSHHFRRFFYRLSGVKIGSGSTIHVGCRFFDPSRVEIGEDTVVGDNAFLDGRDKLIIGSHVAIASSVFIYNSQHDLSDEHFKAICGPVIIEDYCFIGPRAIILPGITVGKGSVIAAGAVVAGNVPPGQVFGGVPAKFIKERPLTDFHYRVGRARWFQ